MTMISKDIFLRLMKVCDLKTLKELSNRYGYKDNWATTTRKREGIPFDICAKVSQEKGVSMDYLLFGSEVNKSVEEKITKLRNSVTDGIFRAIQTGIITPDKDVSISFISEVIMLELDYIYEYNTDETKLMSEKFIESLKKDK